MDDFMRQGSLNDLGLVGRPSDENALVTMGDGGRPMVVNLRLDPTNKTAMKAVGSLLGVDLPLKANFYVQGKDFEVHWLAPDEWMIVSDAGNGNDLVASMAKALEGVHHSAVNVSDNFTVITVEGEKARALLQKAIPLDLHPREFSTGMSLQTHAAKTNVILQQISDAPSYKIYVRRSFSHYLWAWLEDASIGYGLAIASE
ncbi:sarcosine oxidase subunit gamma [Alphaproteobacteria bacterium]|jgi:sarcosine oxidase, subunit gamma|nr:sarcosine oxidase subunit gamma [Alphaproteobacteria bacterium]